MGPTTSMYLAQGLHGLAYGMILFLIASGLNVIFGMMGILNLAHTGFFMLSAYFAYQVSRMSGNYWVGLIILAGVKTVWGTESLPMKMPPSLEGMISIVGMDYPIYRLFIIALALV